MPYQIADETERALLSCCILDPSVAPEALAIAAPSDFRNPALARVAALLGAMLDAGEPIDLATLADRLRAENALDGIGGMDGLVSIVEFEATPVNSLFYARQIRSAALVRERSAIYARLANGAADQADLYEPRLAEIRGELDALESGTQRSYLDLAPSAAELEAMTAAPPIVPLVTHLAYPGMMTVYAGQTNAGKTTSVLRASIDLVYGLEPWTGRHDDRMPKRVLLISKDDTTLSLVRKVSVLAPDETWIRSGGLVLIGKEKQPLSLDRKGVERLGNTVADGRFDLFVLDPYQHFLPPGLNVNDDEAARHTVDVLERISGETGAAAILIHHPRKRPPKAKSPTELTRGERLEEIRGSAVLSQLARAVATLWEVEPGLRMLDAVVNDVPPLPELYFATSAAGEHGVRWDVSGAPTDAEESEIRDRLLGLEAGSYSISAVARAAFGMGENAKPNGHRRAQAKAWVRKLTKDHPERFRTRGDGELEVSE